MRRCEQYFVGDGTLVDQPFIDGVVNGMVRAYLVGKTVVGYARQQPDPSAGASSDAERCGAVLLAWFRSVLLKTREAIVELSVTGAQRYLAQTKNGEGPWNPLHPMKVSKAELAATEVPPYLGAPLLGADGCRVGGLRGPQRRARRSTSTSTASA